MLPKKHLLRCRHHFRLLRRLERTAPDVFRRYQQGEFPTPEAALRRASIRPRPGHPWLFELARRHQILNLGQRVNQAAKHPIEFRGELSLMKVHAYCHVEAQTLNVTAV
jgi:hypothetical protein